MHANLALPALAPAPRPPRASQPRYRALRRCLLALCVLQAHLFFALILTMILLPRLAAAEKPLPAKDAPAPATSATPADPLGPMVPVEPAMLARAQRAADALDIPALEKEALPVFSLQLVNVDPRLEAAKAGLQVGDRIVRANGKTVWPTKAFPESVASKEPYVLTVWRPTVGLKDYTFNGIIGIYYKDCWEATSAYLISKDRNPAWDRWMVVAAINWEDRPTLASAALTEARKAGYNGYLLPVFRMLIATQAAHSQAALDAAALLTENLPEADQRVIYAHLNITRLEMGQIAKTVAMDRDYPHLGLADHQWKPKLLLNREAALTADDLALIQNGKLTAPVKTDYTGKIEPLIAVHTDALKNLAPDAQATLTGTYDDPAAFACGPLTANPAVRFSVTLSKTAKGLQPGSVVVILHDPNHAERLATIALQTDGYLALTLPDIPQLRFNGDFTLLYDTPNKIEISVCGPWCEFRLNDHCVTRQLIDNDPTRELCPMIYVMGLTATLEKLSYTDLQAPAVKPNPLATHPAAGAKLAAIPAVPTDPTARYYYQVWLGSYLKSGPRNPAWDADAVEGLRQYALLDQPNGPQVDIYSLWKTLQSAVDHGCDHPQVRYAAAALTTMVVDSDEKIPLRRAFEKLLKWLESPGAPSLPTLEYSMNYALYNLERGSDFPYVVKRSTARAMRLYALAETIAHDKTIPVNAAFEGILPWINLNMGPGMDRIEYFDPLLKALAKGGPDSAIYHLVKGIVLMNAAWDARGGGWAPDVKPDGWKNFEKYMPMAKEEFLAAYAADKKDANAMANMIYCGMALGESVEDLDNYFELAIAANPNSEGAYHYRLWALMPRWGGTHELMESVARQAVIRYKSNPHAYRYDVAFQLLKLHEMFSNDYSLTGQTNAEKDRLRAEYWTTQGVWKDVHDMFEVVLANNKNDRYVQSHYLWYAAKCQQWRAVERILKDMQGEVCCSEFGGKVGFEYWMKSIEPQLRALKDAEKQSPTPPTPIP